ALRARVPMDVDEDLRVVRPVDLDRGDLRLRGQRAVEALRTDREVAGAGLHRPPGAPVLHDPGPRDGPRAGPGSLRTAAEGRGVHDLLRVPRLLRGVLRQPHAGTAQAGPPGLRGALRA